MIQGCPNIHSIELYHYQGVTDVSVIALSNAYPNLLSVGFKNSYITDSAIIALANRCPRIHEIDDNECKNLTDISFIALSQECHKLKTIKMTHTNITDSSIIALSQGCPDLECIVMIECIYITDAGIEALATGCLSLKVMNIRSKFSTVLSSITLS